MKDLTRLTALLSLVLLFGCGEEIPTVTALNDCVQAQLKGEEQLSSIQKLLLYDYVIHGHENVSFEELNERFGGGLISLIDGMPIEVTSRYDDGNLSLKHIIQLKDGNHQVSDYDLSEEGLSYFRSILVPCE